MENSFKLDANKFKSKNKSLMSETWGVTDKTIQTTGEMIYTKNLGEAFEVWELNAEQTKNRDLALEQLAQKTALEEAELNAGKEREIEGLRQKARLKNWSDEKLADNISKVEQKYAKLQQKRIKLGKKEEARIRNKNRSEHKKMMDAKVKRIDDLLSEQEKGAEQLENRLHSAYYNAYNEPKTYEEEKNKASLRTYAGEYYTEINTYLRTGKDADIHSDGQPAKASKVAKRMIDGMGKFKLNRDIVTTRNGDINGLKHFLGVGNDDTIKNADDIMKLLKDQPMNGHIGADKGFMSTTIIGGGTPEFADMQVEYRIFTPKGTKCAYIAPLAPYEQEKEVLLEAGTVFRLVKVAAPKSWSSEDGKKDKKIVVYMEAIQKKKESA